MIGTIPTGALFGPLLEEGWALYWELQLWDMGFHETLEERIGMLYNELVVNGNIPVKEFHDQILKNGNMPIEMVRQILTDQKPPKDFTTNWRFYEDLE